MLQANQLLIWNMISTFKIPSKTADVSPAKMWVQRGSTQDAFDYNSFENVYTTWISNHFWPRVGPFLVSDHSCVRGQGRRGVWECQRTHLKKSWFIHRHIFEGKKSIKDAFWRPGSFADSHLEVKTRRLKAGEKRDQRARGSCSFYLVWDHF